MMSRLVYQFGLIIMIVLGLSACGQSGDLYLPPPAKQAPEHKSTNT